MNTCQPAGLWRFVLGKFLACLALAGADVGDALVEAQVPVPATLALFALGLAGLGFRGLKQRNAA